MRRIAQYSGFAPSVMMTPELFQVLNVTAGNFITHVLIGRKFNEDGSIPYLSADVRRWYGETIGFWDGEALVTWTSNIQGWMAHGAFEFSSEMQSIEIYTPRKDASGAVNGIDHEVILYDPDALVEPVRIVHRWTKAGELERRQPVPLHRVRAVQLPGERQGHADSAGHDDRIHRPGHLQPALGANLGALFRARHGASGAGAAVRIQVTEIHMQRPCASIAPLRHSQRASRRRWLRRRAHTTRSRCTTKRRPMCSPAS